MRGFLKAAAATALSVNDGLRPFSHKHTHAPISTILNGGFVKLSESTRAKKGRRLGQTADRLARQGGATKGNAAVSTSGG